MEISNLGACFRDRVEYHLVCAVCIAGSLPGCFVVLISRVESLRAEVVGIAERFVDALECIPASHEDLGQRQDTAVPVEKS